MKDRFLNTINVNLLKKLYLKLKPPVLKTRSQISFY